MQRGMLLKITITLPSQRCSSPQQFLASKIVQKIFTPHYLAPFLLVTWIEFIYNWARKSKINHFRQVAISSCEIDMFGFLSFVFIHFISFIKLFPIHNSVMGNRSSIIYDSVSILFFISLFALINCSSYFGPHALVTSYRLLFIFTYNNTLNVWNNWQVNLLNNYLDRDTIVHWLSL